MDNNPSSKEWKLIEKTIGQLTAEQRRSRRWGVIFKLLTFSYLFLILYLFSFSTGGSLATPENFTALVDVRGTILDEGEASADQITTGLRAAFESEGVRGVILRINSPGGSPVQADYVFDEIQRLKGLYPDVPLYAVITDIGASGAYYIAAAADEIYADESSLVGSIGVVSSGFGFVGAMDKLGVDRRLYTAGKRKAFLDPFSEEDGDEVDFWKKVLDMTHEQFISKVKLGRGERLADNEDLFTGLVWSGVQAKELGLIDGFGSAGQVARDIVQAEEIVDFTPQPNPLDQFSESLGVSISRTFVELTGLNGFQLR